MSRAKLTAVPETPPPPPVVDTFVKIEIGAAVHYTGPAGNGPYPGEIVSVGQPDYAPVGVRVTKPSGLVFTVGAELGAEGPGTFTLVG